MKKSILLSPLVIIILVLIMNFYVEQKTKDYIYDDVNNIPKNEVGLLLGTSKYLTSGMENLYYTYRIQAAVELYENKKIDIIIVSGDNSTKEYNEPVMMMNDLVEKGVEKEDIVLDYAGFRTLDSVVRSKEIFEQNKITIISQKFHNERAIFIAMIKDIDAIGYNAKDVNIRYGFKTQVREYLARVKMFFDIAVNKQPKFLGEKILIIK
ncbi:MAG: YdcF family protein [Tissierellales bacterium]|nr:YdcF family protein [Tissierellales bacterium]